MIGKKSEARVVAGVRTGAGAKSVARDSRYYTRERARWGIKLK